MKRLLIALTFIFLYAGCGQSGPLYIPDNPSKISVPPPAAESMAEDSEEENGDPDKE